jgi:hypothetical protein
VFEQPNLPLHSLANRATRAESWLLRIHNEVEQTFFAKKEPELRQEVSGERKLSTRHARPSFDLRSADCIRLDCECGYCCCTQDS